MRIARIELGGMRLLLACLTASLTLGLSGCKSATLPPGAVDMSRASGSDSAVGPAPGCDGPCPCSADTQCGGATPRCDRNTGACVACLPTDDNCPAGMRCVANNGVYACSGACMTASDCPRTDAGRADDCCDGVCIDTGADTLNCGGCGKVCPSYPNATAVCLDGTCALGACAPGYTDCDSSPLDGCEVHTATDPANCGSCGKACSAGVNAMATCAAGVCNSTCATGFADCAMNGSCQTDVASDSMNCGGCGMACAAAANATVGCVNSRCAIASCQFGYANCDQNPTNGCEANLLSTANCGACGVVCAAPANATAGCNAGLCGIGACAPLFGDCDGLAADGCEKDLQTDVANCGGCNEVCLAPNATPVCLAGKCGVSACNAGYDDCDGNAVNGCESNRLTDANNCGGCGNKCAAPANAGGACASGMCAFVCNFGYADCDGNPANGCETSLNTPAHCGSCANACALANATAACGAGQCTVASCNSGYADCDGNPADGCEKNVTGDVNNCGGCNTVCAPANANAECQNGSCGFATCQAGYADCDKNAANGCEVNLNTSAANCGRCGMACGANTPTCSAGTCVAATSVVVVAASGYATDAQTQLKNTGAFSTVDLFNAQTGTPTVAQLQAYGAALVFSDSTFNDPVTLGNNLATYWNGGGRVVIATFADTTIAVTGTWGTAANGYIFIAPAAQAEPTDSLGAIAEPASPLMAGVKTWAATAAYRSTGAVINNGVVVASFASGTPMVVRGVLNGRNIVELNFYPPSSAIRADFWTGDGATLLKNALMFQ